MKEFVRRVRPHLTAAGLVLALGAPTLAHARELVFVETWENGTNAWRTEENNGGDCKGWPQCPFGAAATASMPAAMVSNPIFIQDSAGGECGGKYLHVPWQMAGENDGGNVVVSGAVLDHGNQTKNSQFKVLPGDRLCVVAWIRHWDEDGVKGGTWAGPYVGINYTGAHGVVDAGHNHGTHWLIGAFGAGAHDTAPDAAWPLTVRQSYPNIVLTNRDGLWHRYKTDFVVGSSPYDTADQRQFSPELGASQSWVPDGIVYGQPRISLFGEPGDGSVAFPHTRNDIAQSFVTKDADFGDIYFFRAPAPEAPCPTDAELDALAWTSDHVVCGAGKTCNTTVAALPATSNPAGTPAYPGNTASVCYGCDSSFGAAPAGPTVCAETSPFCLTPGGKHGGNCTPCGGDQGAAGAPAATKCTGANPTCLTDGMIGACGKCATDASCADPAHPGPSCDPGTGACFACKSDQGGANAPCLAANPRCDATTGLCSKCVWNDDCAGPGHAGPQCDVATGQCATCVSDFGAAAGPTTCTGAFPLCLTAPIGAEPVGVCGKCTTAADCTNPAGATTHEGGMCDVATGACGKCDGDLGTSTTAYACTSTDLPTCRTDGNCVKCASDADCTNPAGKKLHTLSRCNVGTGACEGPPAAVPQCDGDKNTSTTADACSDMASPTCHNDGNCGKCVADTDCVNPPGKKLHSFSVCDQATGACDLGPPAEVPLANATVDGGNGSSGGCGCTSVPTRSNSAGVVAMGIVAAMLLRRRKRED